MKRFLLLVLSLMAGCEARSDKSTVKGCKEGWVEFSCKYPNTNGKYQRFEVDIDKRPTVRSTKKDVWENKERVSVYHDTKNKNLRVAIKPLKHEDFGEYECEFKQGPDSSQETEVKWNVVERAGCQSQWIQTAYRTAETTITCDHTGNKDKFLCKDNGSGCEDILSTKSSVKSNGTFTLTGTNGGLSVSISNVSSQHAGVYWCGEESGGRYRAALRRIQLEVKDGSWLTVTVPAVVCVAVLVLVIILVLVYKRFKRSKNTNGEAQNNNEDCAYAEIQEHPQKPGSRTPLRTVYATTNFPTNPSSTPLHYDNLNFQNTPSSARNDDPRPTYSTVNHPAKIAEDPFYSTVNMPQQH